LERRCLKWACMSHLDTSNISYGQKKGQDSNCQFDSRPLKVGNRPISLRAGDVPHTIEKLLTRNITLLQASPQSEVFTQNYGPPKLWESQFWEFQDSQMKVPGQNVIWVLAPWPGIEYIIREKVVASPKSRSW
jgi:hypothetical protein